MECHRSFEDCGWDLGFGGVGFSVLGLRPWVSWTSGLGLWEHQGLSRASCTMSWLCFGAGPCDSCFVGLVRHILGLGVVKSWGVFNPVTK